MKISNLYGAFVVLFLMLSACSRGDKEVEQVPIGGCDPQNLIGYDCACFDTVTNKEEYAAMKDMLTKIAESKRDQLSVEELSLTQANINSLLKLTAEADSECGFGFQ